MNNNRVAILGAGFIGRNFISASIRNGSSLSVLDHKACPEEFSGKVSWIQGDLSSEFDLFRAIAGADVVFHFISSTVPGDEIDEGSELIQNVVQTLRLLKLCVRAKVRRIVFVSSASVYGLQNTMPIPETATTNPISSHGIHKLTIEKYLQLYQYEYGLECKIARLSNPYGPGQSVVGRQGFIALAIGKILVNDPIVLRGDGSTIRDFIYIDDVVDALQGIAFTTSPESLFNIASGLGHSLKEVVSVISDLLGRKLDLDPVSSRYVDIPVSILCTDRISRVIGFHPQTSLRDGLFRTLSNHGLINQAKQAYGFKKE